MITHLQELGDPILTIPAAIQNKSYYNPPGNDSHETLIRLGDADRVIAESPLIHQGSQVVPGSSLLLCLSDALLHCIDL